MADYYAFIRTNYFGVTDKTKFMNVIASCRAEDNIKIFEHPNDPCKFAFGCYGNIYGIPDCEDDFENDIYEFYSELRDILIENDAIIITEIGYEKMRYLTGICTVITKQDIQFVNLCDKGVELAGNMLQNPDFVTQMEY